MRLYKRTYGLRQICNIAVYIVHSACTIHLLNLPEKIAKRDIIHGVKHLEEIAEDWLCARRTLSILSVLARKWKIELPEEASLVFARTDAKYGIFSTADVPSPKADLVVQTPPSAVPSPPRPTPPVHPRQAPVRTPSQLQQSLYSYIPGSQPGAPNNGINLLQQQPTTNPIQPFRQSNGVGSMTAPNDSILASVPYPRHPYNISSSRTITTPTTDLQRSDSAVMSDTTTASNSMTRQVSPSTMFGGVDALVESQDWWLRDQASLAVGFDNWMEVGNGGDMSAGGLGNGNSAEIDPMTGMGSGFYMPPTGNRGSSGDVYQDDDWTTYN